MRQYAVSGSITLGDVAELLPARYSAQSTRRTRVQRTWLDTADARLATRGMTLLHVVDGDHARLVFEHAGTTNSLPADVEPPRWPHQLPEIAAKQVTPLVDVRALLPQRVERNRASVLHVLDDEEKTVARLWLETPAAGNGKRRDSQVLRVEEMRGYRTAAERIAKALAVDPRLTGPAPAPPTGGPSWPTLERDLPTSAASAAVLTHLFDVIEANLDGTVSALDTEFLHDLRVAVRRTRSALKLTAADLPMRLSDRFAARFRWLGDLTTPARDLDVLLLELQPTAGLAPTDPELVPLHAFLSERLAECYSALGKGLRSARFRQLAESYRAALGQLAVTAKPTEQIGPTADAWAAAAMRRVLRRGLAITHASPATDLHDLRKRCKELRYCLELFGSVWQRSRLDPFVRELKALQDVLGTFQDSEIHHAMLAGWAEEIATAGRAPTATVLAIGRLTATLEERKAHARAEFGPRFARFSATANQRRFEKMTSGTRG